MLDSLRAPRRYPHPRDVSLQELQGAIYLNGLVSTSKGHFLDGLRAGLVGGPPTVVDHGLFLAQPAQPVPGVDTAPQVPVGLHPARVGLRPGDPGTRESLPNRSASRAVAPIRIAEVGELDHAAGLVIELGTGAVPDAVTGNGHGAGLHDKRELARARSP